jgi:hypothetical protein
VEKRELVASGGGIAVKGLCSFIRFISIYFRELGSENRCDLHGAQCLVRREERLTPPKKSARLLMRRALEEKVEGVGC